MRKTKLRLALSFFGIMLGGLLLMRIILAVFLGLLDGEAVLPRIWDRRDLLIALLSSLAATGLWSFLSFRK